VIEFSGRGILLDIEGTTSSVSYVYDVMFPFARERVADYLAKSWGTPELQTVREQVARDVGHESFAAWQAQFESDVPPERLLHDEIVRLMDADAKATGLKMLQGLVWEAGFRDGLLRAHVFDDVPPALATWKDAGIEVRIYSSGSVHAQKLFFAHSVHGDLLPYIAAHYDTTTGPKREPASYRTIAADFALSPERILFLSDVVEELDAAAEAGLTTALCIREGNAPAPQTASHPQIRSLAEIQLI